MKYNGHDIADNEFHSEIAYSLSISEGCAMDTEVLEKMLAESKDYIRRHTDAGNRYADNVNFVCIINSECVDGEDVGNIIEMAVYADRYETPLEREIRIGREKEYWDAIDERDKRIAEQMKVNMEKRADMRKSDDVFCRYEYEREIMKRNGCSCIPSFDKWKKRNGIE